MAIAMVLTEAAKAFASELAGTVGQGIIETLFNQREIALDLAQIKRMLEQLTAFIRNELPAAIERATDEAVARKASFDVSEKAVTIRAAMNALDEAKPRERERLVEELAGHAVAILETGGALISYGQPYYGSVGLAFASATHAFAKIATWSPARVSHLRTRAVDWKARLTLWVDANVPTSLAAISERLETRHSMALRLLPPYQTWVNGREHRVALSWQTRGESVFVSGAWFGLYKSDDSTHLLGDTLGQVLQPGLTFESAIANNSLAFNVPAPELWQVKANVPPTMSDYNQLGAAIGSLNEDEKVYLQKAPGAKNAAALIRSLLLSIDKILDATISLEPSQFVDATTK